MSKSLIVFARTPELGKVKTRLAASLGTKKALVIYKKLLTGTLSITANINANINIYWSEKAPNNKYQIGNDLGERMHHAILTEMSKPHKVCLIGTDTPTLTPTLIKQAFNKLAKYDIVFGPAKDGGYYLVACKAPPPKELFLHKKWSHNNVLTEALEICKLNNLTVSLLPVLMDIDTEEDYHKWQANE